MTGWVAVLPFTISVAAMPGFILSITRKMFPSLKVAHCANYTSRSSPLTNISSPENKPAAAALFVECTTRTHAQFKGGGGVASIAPRTEELLAHSATVRSRAGVASSIVAGKLFLFRAPIYSFQRTDGLRQREAAQAIAAIIRACSVLLRHGEQPAAFQSAGVGRSGGVVVGREGGWMGAMNFIMQEPSQWEMLSRWHRETSTNAQK